MCPQVKTNKIIFLMLHVSFYHWLCLNITVEFLSIEIEDFLGW